MQIPSMGIVLRIEREKSETAVPAEILQIARFDYVDALDEAARKYSTQIRLWEGPYRGFSVLSGEVCATLKEVSRLLGSSNLSVSKSTLEFAVFTEADNQEIEIPSDLLKFAVEMGAHVSVTFFRTQE